MYETIKQKRAALYLVLMLVAILFAIEARDRSELLELRKDCAHDVSILEARCVGEYAAEVVSRDGDVSRAYRLVEGVFANRSGFQNHCAFAMSNTGMFLARENRDFQDLHLGIEGTYCNYAFMLAYVREIVLKDRGVERGVAFCEHVSKELRIDTPGARGECYRGIGQSLPFISDSAAGKPPAMMGFAIRECEEVTDVLEEQKLCISGAFQYIDIAQSRGMHGLSVNESDPLYLCHAQASHYRDMCYNNVKRVLFLGLSPDKLRNFSTTIDEIQSRYAHVPPQSLQVVAHTLAYDEVTRTAPALDIEQLIGSCQALSLELQPSCISGASLGIAKNGPADNEYRQLELYCDAIDQTFPPEIASRCPSTAAIDFLRGKYRPSLYEEYLTVLGFGGPSLTR